MSKSPSIQSFGNKLVLAKSQWRNDGTFADESHLRNLIGQDSGKNYFGVLRLFNQMNLIRVPFFNMDELEKSTLYVDDLDNAEVLFDMPYRLELPSIKEDLTGDNLKPGIDGLPFEVVLGNGGLQPYFQVGDIITADQYDGQDYRVLTIEEKTAEGFRYKLALVSGDPKNDYVDKKWLKVGTQFIKTTNRLGEYDEFGSGLTQGTGMLKLKQKFGSWRSVEYQMTGNAQRIKIPNQVDFERKYQSSGYLNPLDPNFVLAIGETTGGMKSGNFYWIRMIEIMMMQEYLNMEANELMWAKGGFVQNARTTDFLSSGLYEQMKLGNFFNIPRYSRQIIMDRFGQVFRNRPDIADVDRYFTVEAGRGATYEWARIFSEELLRTQAAFGGINNMDALKIVSGDPMALKVGYRVATAFIPGAGWFTIKHNPALDASPIRGMDEPYKGGFSKRSYTSMIMDVTKGDSTNATKPSSQVEFASGMGVPSSNLYLIKDKGLPGMKWTYVNGRTSPYPISAGKGSVASSLADKSTTFLEGRSSIMMVDPTRTILLQLS